MPDIGAVLKNEIKRLSHRTTKVFYSPLKKDVVELKRVVMRQRQAIQTLERNSARLIADLNSRIARLPEVTAQDAQKIRISPRIILAQRNRLGFSQEAFGRLLGVSTHTIFLWEHSKSTPRQKIKTAFAAIRHLGKREARQRLEAIASVNGGAQQTRGRTGTPPLKD
ncbi:MAG TPA: hypothetical protein DCZ01_10285 [Elusimicrobia bacterium]|nr:hypothetical protein [Elusimicrobiota bacterium]